MSRKYEHLFSAGNNSLNLKVCIALHPNNNNRRFGTLGEKTKRGMDFVAHIFFSTPDFYSDAGHVRCACKQAFKLESLGEAGCPCGVRLFQSTPLVHMNSI